jgi:hypothetical protein
MFIPISLRNGQLIQIYLREEISFHLLQSSIVGFLGTVHNAELDYTNSQYYKNPLNPRNKI